MPEPGRTGLVLPVPAADPLLGSVAANHPGAVRGGVPAHVSLLYPFVPDGSCDEQVGAALREVFADTAPFEIAFDACARHEDFVYLRPEPAGPLDALIGEVRRRWPELVPYEGRYDVLEPHVTVAMRTPVETAEVIRELAAGWLPVRDRLAEAWLVAFDGGWQLRERFAFGGQPRG